MPESVSKPLVSGSRISDTLRLHGKLCEFTFRRKNRTNVRCYFARSCIRVSTKEHSRFQIAFSPFGGKEIEPARDFRLD